MVGDELCELLRAISAQASEPLCDGGVRLSAAGEREATVRDVADEGVLEGVLELAREA